MSSLVEPEPSPFRRDDATLTAEAITGREIFRSLDCASCHSGPYFTDSEVGIRHDVGTLTDASGDRLGEPLDGIDTPSLRGIWATAPYLHDGSAATLHEVFTAKNPGDLHGATSTLTTTELNALVGYLLQIDGREPAPAPAPTVTSFTPESAGIGSEITIFGENLSTTSYVSFGGIVSRDVTVVSDGEIVVRVPPGATTGTMRVQTHGGSASTTTEITISVQTEVAFEGLDSGMILDSVTVSTDGDVPAVSGHTYVAAISMKPATAVDGVVGLGLSWSRVDAQCSAREQAASRCGSDRVSRRRAAR